MASQNGIHSSTQIAQVKEGIAKEASKVKPLAKRWDHLLSREAATRQSSIFQALHRHMDAFDVLSLGPGAPSPQYYPFDHISVQVPSIQDSDPSQAKWDTSSFTTNKYDIKNGKSEYDLSAALTYGQGTGARQLVGFVTELTTVVHDPPYADWKCIMTGGNTSALDLAFRTFTERGTYALADEYTYATAFECANPLGVKVLGIKLDEQGPIPTDLDYILTSWDEEKRGSKKPHVLYTVPTGHNPTGATQSLERRQEIYQLAQKHDLIILEDDPYYFLQLTPEVAKDFSETVKPVPKSDFLPSFLSLDIDGRVFRMDSCSKIMAPGLRTGWVTASEQITERIVRAHETSLQQPSGFSQAFLYKLLAEQWGIEGLFRWFSHLQIGYTIRRDALMRACEANLPQKVASWNVPQAGVFAWVKINWELHPNSEKLGPREIETEIWNATAKAGTLIVPGSWFQPDPLIELPTLFFRINYASLQPELMPEATKRFGDVLRGCFQLN